jgi:hypothetical protein
MQISLLITFNYNERKVDIQKLFPAVILHYIYHKDLCISPPAPTQASHRRRMEPRQQSVV